MIKNLLVILLSCSISLSISAVPWQCALEKLKIKSIQCAQVASRITARAISIETPLEKLRAAGALVFVGGSLYGMLVVPDKFFGSIGQDFEKKFDEPRIIKLQPRGFIGPAIEWYKAKNNKTN